MAGRVQLLASGPQDIVLHRQSRLYSHFLESFKKHSNFSSQHVDIKSDNSGDFGKTTREVYSSTKPR